MNTKYPLSSFTLIVAFLCIALVGIALSPLIPVKLNPSEQLPSLTVTFQYSGHSARTIEAGITSKLESMLSRIHGVRGIYSNSGEGWGNVWMDFDPSTDLEFIRFEVASVIRQAWPGLPAGTTYPQIHIRKTEEDATRPFISYTLHAAESPLLIQQFAEEILKPRLSLIEGVAKVEISGSFPREWKLEYDSEELTRLGISVESLTAALSQAYHQEFLGICAQGSSPPSATTTGDNPRSVNQWIRIMLRPSVPTEGFDASKVQVALPHGKRIGLERLVKVTYQESSPSSYFRINGLHSIYLNLTAEERANQLIVGRKVVQEMEKMSRLLPVGYESHLGYDATEYIRNELQKIFLRTGITLLILLLFVWMVSRNPRYMLLILISLVLSVATSVVFYYFFHLEMQLYSLAGVTLSLSLMIDSTILMADHVRRHQNRKAFLPILAATVTTIGSLAVVFFLDEKIRLNLQDFAAVICINLFVSLGVALFLVPALIDKMGLNSRKRPTRRSRGPFRVKKGFLSFYQAQIRFLGTKKKVVFCFFMLLFGLPVFLLPEKIEESPGRETWIGKRYNQTLGSDTYQKKLKPVLETALGGTWRLFVQKVYEESYFTRREETVLSVYATLPNGSTLEQMNNLIKQMEFFLSEFSEIRQFQTHIYTPNRACIQIFFPKELQKAEFPYVLKSKLISRALELGGGSWQVHGLEDQGFSNELKERAGSFRVKMFGYNYDELYVQAERLKDTLLSNRRIREVEIRSHFSGWKDDYQEYFIQLDKRRMAEEGVQTQTLFTTLQPLFRKEFTQGTVYTENRPERLKLTARQDLQVDQWHMERLPLPIKGKAVKLGELARIVKEQAPQEVAKENQQYRLCLQYEYIGASLQGYKVLEKELERFRKELPVGYSVESESEFRGWGSHGTKPYHLLGWVALIVFLTTGVLFNSVKKPLIVWLVIPVSFIGVFLTFYGFGLNFDQGGFASFILLCGITVNATIYLLDEYDTMRKSYPGVDPQRIYLKAWNRKIVPIFLTIVSTILGFLPFMIGSEKEDFWFPLAAGTIGGLLMSVFGIYIIVPLALKEVRQEPQKIPSKQKNEKTS